MVLKYKNLLLITFASILFYTNMLAKDSKKETPKNQNNQPKVCCKIRYKGGGFDYFVTEVRKCKKDKRYVSHTQYSSSLCLEWKDSFKIY